MGRNSFTGLVFGCLGQVVLALMPAKCTFLIMTMATFVILTSERLGLWQKNIAT